MKLSETKQSRIGYGGYIFDDTTEEARLLQLVYIVVAKEEFENYEEWFELDWPNRVAKISLYAKLLRNLATQTRNTILESRELCK